MIRKRTLPAAMLLLASLLLGADTLAWLQMQRMLDHRLERMARDARRAGWQLETAPGQRGGWPFAATLTLAGPRLHGADTLLPGGITWSGERITAVFSPLHPRRITILAGGTQTISAGNGGPDANLGHSLRFWGAETALHLPVSAGRSEGQVSFDARALHVALPGAGPDDVLTVAGLDGTWRWAPSAHAIRLALRGIGLPRADPLAVPHIVPSASLELSLIGGPDPHIADLAAQLRAWRDAGGRILLRRAAIEWSDASIEASGAASLDGNFQPYGAFSVRVRGADALLDRLVHSGRITASAAGAIHAVLGLVEDARDTNGEVNSLVLPLDLRGGTLLLGQIPLLHIPGPPYAALRNSSPPANP